MRNVKTFQFPCQKSLIGFAQYFSADLIFLSDLLYLSLLWNDENGSLNRCDSLQPQQDYMRLIIKDAFGIMSMEIGAVKTRFTDG